MTVPADSRRREYIGNGVTTVFNGPMAFQPSHVQVFRVSGGPLGPEEHLIPSGQYSIDYLGRVTGTRVVFSSPVPDGQKIVMLRTMPYTQEVSIENQGAFHARTVEDGYDALGMQIQQLADGVDRSIRIPDSWPPGVDTRFPFPEASRLIGWNSDGSALRNTDPSGPGDLSLRSDLADPTGGGALVAWRQSGVGVRTRDLGSKARDELHINDFPNTGNGVANDSDALENALNAAVSSGRTLRGEAGRTYRLNRSISIPVPVGGTLSVDMQGATIFCDNASITIGSPPTLLLSTTFSVEPRKGDPFLRLASVAGIQKGDIIYVECPIMLEPGNPVMHYYLVEEIDGNDVYIEGVVIEDMTDAQIAADGGSGSWSVQVFRPSARIEFCNARFVVSDPGGTHSVLVIRGAYRAIVDNLDFRGHTRNQLYLQYCGHTLTTRIHCSDFGYVEKDEGYASFPSAPGGLSYGYGIIHARNYSSIVRDVIGTRGWHVTDVSRGQMYIKFFNVICLRNSYGLAQHRGCWDVEYNNCEVHGNLGANATSCAYLRFINCRFIDCRSNAVVYSSAAREVEFLGCTFSLAKETGGASTGSFVRPEEQAGFAARSSDGHRAKFVFMGNTVRWFGRGSCGLPSGDIIVKGNHFELIQHCEVLASAYNGSRIDTPEVYIEDNVVNRGCFNVSSSSRVFYMVPGTGPCNIYFRNNTVMHAAITSVIHAFSADCDGTYIVEGNTTNCFSVVRAVSGPREIKHLNNNSGLNRSVAGPNTVIVNCVGNRYVIRLTEDNHVPTVDAGNVQVSA